MKALITGSSGLIGSQSVKFLAKKGFDIIGIDNDMRSYFFGEEASTNDSKEKLLSDYPNFTSYELDIRNYADLERIFQGDKFDIIIHCAAQPSHDWAAKEPLTDFTINALGTMNLLELTRLYSPDATFIFTSTNKVYGDRPNFDYYNNGSPDCNLGIKELETRYEGYDINTNELVEFDESKPIDRCKHSIFGASKVSADIMCQEYGKYFGMNVGIFRGGCLTGPNHAGTEMHGFLSYLVKCIVNDDSYTIFGYKGKQVRDNIHSWDLVNMFWNFHKNPNPGEVYNAGGGRNNSISILEAINKINEIAGTTWSKYTISEKARIGDHIWYISDLTKFKSHYPDWDITINLDETIKQMVDFEKKK